MLRLHSPQIMQETADRWRQEQLVSFVPTMGCLHDGHLELVRKAQSFGGKCIVSIFVNPLQFGPKEDFDRYPRPFEEDVEKLSNAGVDCLFAPTAKDFYPEGFDTKVVVGKLAHHLDGKSRPGHFDGVATVCLKLFQSCKANVAVFGEKDFQQVRVIQQLTADFNLPLQIAVHPTVREEDGLALSSRNRYLGPEDRRQAKQIPEQLFAARKRAQENGETTVGEITGLVTRGLSGLTVDYVSVCSEADLVPLSNETKINGVWHPRLFVAAKAGSTRLIDNISLNGT